jgi:predicted transcriptional regulator
MTEASGAKSVEDIQRELAEARQRLADNIGSLINEVHPKAVVHRTIDDAKATVQEQFKRLKSEIKDESGWRTDRIIAVAGSVLGVLTFVGIVHGVRK